MSFDVQNLVWRRISSLKIGTPRGETLQRPLAWLVVRLGEDKDVSSSEMASGAVGARSRGPKPRLAADFFAENWHAARGDLAASLGVVGGEVGRGQGREQQRGAVGAMAAMASGGVASWRRSVGAAGTARGVVLGLARAEWEKEERASRQREGVARERRKMTRKDEK